MSAPFLGGTTFIHNGIEHDYCFEAAISSMAEVCDEVVVVEAGSTDDTREVLDGLAWANRKIRIVHADWKPARLDEELRTDWTRDLAEIARSHLTASMNLYVQGDEVLHEDDYGRLRYLAKLELPSRIHRLNFWTDHRHVVPRGYICADYVCRLAPSSFPCAWGSESLVADNPTVSEIRLFHYGFIRNGTGFRKKSEIMTTNFIGEIDPVIYRYEKEGPSALADYIKAPLLPYNGTHPKSAQPWLKERGFA